MLVYLRSIANLEAAEGVNEVYEFQIDEDVFHVVVDNGKVDAVQGRAKTAPVVVMRTDLATFVQIGSRRVSPLTQWPTAVPS